MGTSQSLQFDHRDRQRIYEYVERHGSVNPDTVREELLPGDARGFRHHLSMLRRDGYLTHNDEGDLQVALEESGSEEFTGGDVEFTVRPARQEDLTGIVGAIRQVAERGTYIVAESVAQELDQDEALLRHNELESRMFFVATVEDEVVGWVHVRAPELAKLRHTAELTVGVLKTYRGNNIGSHLLSRGLEWAAQNEYEKVYQSVPATNPTAIEFLQEHGWETEAVREDHYLIDDEYVDELMMAVEL
jgi:ribosomal protein S18 acetylase RimI-like enzyme